jgi:hypothetical protein
MRIALVSIALIGFLLGGCVGHPIPIPYPESELGPPPGMPTGDSGETVIFEWVYPPGETPGFSRSGVP